MWSITQIVICTSLAVVAAPAGLCAGLTIPAQIAGPGASVPLAISFVSQGDLVSGLQFDLAFNDSALSLSVVVGDALRSSGKSLYLAATGSGPTRFLITDLNQNAISDGVIVNLFVNVGPAASPGEYPVHFASAVASDAGGLPIPVTLSDGSITVQSIYGAAVVPEGVLNGASLLPGPVAPGGIVTIMGSAMAPAIASTNTSITFDGFRAPLLYVAPDQINAVVPFEIDGRSAATLEIVSPPRLPVGTTVPVASASPAIFTLTGNGTGRGAVLNQDGTVNSPDNPAQRGSIIVLFATGAGQTNPPGIDGMIPTTVLPKPVLPVSVRIGDSASPEILYAGAAPWLISGVLQVNCRVPAEVAVGRSVPVRLQVGDVTSPPVTIAVN